MNADTKRQAGGKSRTAEEKHDAGQNMPNFVFVTGSHKSGTSWLAKMVNGHKEIGIPQQELWLMGHDNALFETLREPLEKWFSLPTVSSQFKTEESRISAEKKILRGAMRGAIVAGLPSMDGIEVVGDKTPAFYAMHVERLHYIFPDAVYVQIVRDPRDVIVSHHFHAYRLNEWVFFDHQEKAKSIKGRLDNGESVGPELLDDGAVMRILNNWMKVQGRVEDARNLFPKRCYILRYEDLLVDPDAHLKQIFALTETPIDDEGIAKITERFTFENMSNGRTAGQEDPSSFFRKGVSGDWKNYFSDDLNEKVRERASDLMNAFEYE